MSLPSNEHTFTVSILGERTRQKYDGSFTVKCVLTNRELIEVGLRTDAYNNGSKSIATSGIGIMNRAIAHMEIATIKSPSWWRDSDGGRELLDLNVLYEVYNKALEAEKVYDERITKAADDAQAAAEANPKKSRKE